MFCGRETSNSLNQRDGKLGFWLLLMCLSLPHRTNGQVMQNRQQELSELDAALAKAKSRTADARDVVVIANARAAQAIPALEEQFKTTTRLDLKMSIASGLVRLKDFDDTYWNFLLEQVTLAVDSDLPDPLFDDKGNMRPVTANPELATWAREHNTDLNTAGQSALYGLPGKVMQLGMTGDPRGIPVLRRALNSHNTMIVIVAAKGLAQMQDKDSIPLIIEAGRRSRALASSIAEAALVFFDDPRAQAFVDANVSPDRAKIWRDARAQGLKPFGN